MGGTNLLLELKNIKEVLLKETRKLKEVLNYLKLNGDYFSNAWIALKVLLTMPV